MKGMWKCRSRPLISSAAAKRDDGSHPMVEAEVLCTSSVCVRKRAERRQRWSGLRSSSEIEVVMEVVGVVCGSSRLGCGLGTSHQVMDKGKLVCMADSVRTLWKKATLLPTTSFAQLRGYISRTPRVKEHFCFSASLPVHWYHDVAICRSHYLATHVPELPEHAARVTHPSLHQHHQITSIP